MKSATKDKAYTRPIQKLARFFESSRNQWKAKCREAKRKLKYFKNRNRVLQENRDQWREQAQRLTQELAEAKATECQLREEVDRLKAQETATAPVAEGLTEFAIIPQRHQYSVGHAALFIKLGLSDAASLRCAGRALARLLTRLPLPFAAPVWSTGRLWILRLGYYKLMRPKAPAEPANQSPLHECRCLDCVGTTRLGIS